MTGVTGEAPRSAALHPVAFWGVLGFCAIIGQAIYRLAPLALEPVEQGMTALEWGLFGLSAVSMAYMEGYRGFQVQLAPRLVARAIYLAENRGLLFSVLAPLFCMSLFHASRRRLLITWCLYAAIITMIIAVRQLSQPWRGIVDAGVVVGLIWGVVSVLVVFVRALAGRPPQASPELPGSDR